MMFSIVLTSQISANEFKVGFAELPITPELIDEPDLQEKLRKKYIKVLNELGEDGLTCEKPIIYKDEEWVEQ